MKAIRQIIEYLVNQGELSFRDLRALDRLGFLPEELGFELTPARETSEPRGAKGDVPAVDPAEIHLEEWGRDRRRKAGGSRTVVRKGPVLFPAALAARLAGRFDAWRADLDGLRRVGRRLDGSATWEEAAVAIRNAPLDEVLRAVREGIDRDDPSLKALLVALNMDDYRAVVDRTGLHGPAVAAYRAIIACKGVPDLGKHAWLLKRAEVRLVFNLRMAQIRLGLVWPLLRIARPGLFASPIR